MPCRVVKINASAERLIAAKCLYSNSMFQKAMDQTQMQAFFPEREIDLSKFVTSFDGVLYWGKEKKPSCAAWETDEDNTMPNEINVIKKIRQVATMGFGSTFVEAYRSCLAKLEERLDKAGWDFILIGNGVPLRNGANFQYQLSATLHKVDRSYDSHKK